MKISFDYGTNQSIDTIVIYQMLEGLLRGEKFRDLNVGKCCVYLSLYDEDGLSRMLVRESDGAEIDYVVRAKKYQRIPKDTEYLQELAITLKDGEKDVLGYVYVKYTK